MDLDKQVWPHLKQNDRLVAEVAAQDIWISVNCKMKNSDNVKIKAEFEAKFENQWTGKEFKRVV